MKKKPEDNNGSDFEFLVRPYEVTDESAVVAMAESARAADPGSPHLDAARWRYVCNDPHADPELFFQVAAFPDKRIVGIAYRFDPPRHDGGSFRAVFVVVAPEFRRMGIGRALYNAVACENDFDKSDEGWHLVTGADSKSDAGLPFAKAMGFKKNSERLVMRRSIPGKPFPEFDCPAAIEPFLGAHAYQDWAKIMNAAFANIPGTAKVTADELEDNRPDGFRPEHVIFARVEKTRAGVLFLRETGNGGFLETLAVLPEYQKKSIGSALLVSSLEYLEDRGHKSCEAVVDKKNSGALKLFRNFEFKEIDRRSFFIKKPKKAGNSGNGIYG